MPLIKKAIKYGALFAIAREGVKYMEKRDKKPTRELEQQLRQEQPSVYDASGYYHQPYCNGGCGGHCSDVVFREAGGPREDEKLPAYASH